MADGGGGFSHLSPVEIAMPDLAAVLSTPRPKVDIYLPSCIPPTILLCQGEDPSPGGPGYVFCLCEVPAGPPPPPPKICTMTLQYSHEDPRAVWANKPEHGCDQTGLELAMLAMLVKLKLFPLP